MIPRAVQMAAEVTATLTPSELNDYGNIILSGYLTTGPNTINKKAYQWKETLTPPVNLPSITSVRPALKSWTQYQEYYTQLQPNGYGVNPGDPTMFNYNVHSYTRPFGPVLTLTNLVAGADYLPGSYLNVLLTGGRGAGASVDVTVNGAGAVTAAALNATGANYAVGDILTFPSDSVVGYGYGFTVTVGSVTVAVTPGQSRWAQPPYRYFGAGFSAALYPKADNLVAPPIDIL